MGGFTSDPPVPDVENTYQRIDAVLSRKIGEDFTKLLGYDGRTTAKLRYSYERNNMINWATDGLTAPYYNPSYTAQSVVATFALEW